MQEEATKVLFRSLRELQSSSKYSDLKIVCGEEVFLAHKAIICPRSEFFEKACDWGIHAQSKSEVDLSEDDPKLVQLMVDYFYQLDYDDGSQTIKPPLDANRADSRTPWDHDLTPTQQSKTMKSMMRDGTWETRLTQGNILEESWGIGQTSVDKNAKVDLNSEPIVINASLYALADKYAIEDLKSLAKHKFLQTVARGGRKEAFVHAADLVFRNTPSFDMGLRSVVIDTLDRMQGLTQYEEVQELLESGIGIASQLIKVLLQRPRH